MERQRLAFFVEFRSYLNWAWVEIEIMRFSICSSHYCVHVVELSILRVHTQRSLHLSSWWSWSTIRLISSKFTRWHIQRIWNMCLLINHIWHIYSAKHTCSLVKALHILHRLFLQELRVNALLSRGWFLFGIAQW